MTVPAILNFLKAILPTKRIAAWILGILGALLAMLMGINNTDLKAQFCANPEVALPKIEMGPAVTVPPVPALPAPDVKK